MALIGKSVAEIEEKPHYQVWFMGYACSHYVNQHFRRAGDSAVVSQSAEQCPCYCHGKRCIWPSCSMNLPPRHRLRETVPSELARETEAGVNQLLELKCASEGVNLRSLLNSHCHLFVRPSASPFTSSEPRQLWVAAMSVNFWRAPRKRALKVSLFTARGSRPRKWIGVSLKKKICPHFFSK